MNDKEVMKPLGSVYVGYHLRNNDLKKGLCGSIKGGVGIGADQMLTLSCPCGWEEKGTTIEEFEALQEMCSFNEAQTRTPLFS